jgi:predicted alpha-1,6-mannanase (GH76 family)
MQIRFRTRGSTYRRDGRLHRPWTAAHLWPFARALVATLDLSGVRGGPPAGFGADAGIAEHLHTLERYWDVTRGEPAYSSDVLGTRLGGDRYYDDNAWVGLALVQLERMRPGSSHLDRASELFRFAQMGWDRRSNVPYPGGVFWVEQGVGGVGSRNHDRNTVSNAPNAALGLHLAELTRSQTGAVESIRPDDMYEWVNAALDASRDGDCPATGLFWDKLRGDGTLDAKFWSYNQGSMIGVNVLLARRGGQTRAGYLARAEAIARKALRHFAEIGYESQPPAFNAIFFRNLLLLHAATADDRLRTQIVEVMRAYADRAWHEQRTRSDCFRFYGGGVTLLDQSAMVQILALLAWDPVAYHKLA